MGKKFKKLVAMALSFAILATFCMVPLTANAEQAPLKFGEDGKFKIVVFSDVQDQYPVHQRVLNIMRQAIERENPDLVVFTGDMTEINTKDVEVDYRKTVEQILAPVVEAGVPYSIVFGNHDPQSYYDGQVTSKEAMLAVWQSIGDCRTTDPAPEISGTGTCKIPIYASNGNDVAFNLWMVDSGSYQNPLDTTSGYDNPHADQLAWMAANNDEDVNSIVFQHIPMPETYNLFVEDENGEGSYGGKKYALELKEGVVGKATEFPSTIYADDSAGEFATLKEMGNVLGVFSGHDHLNDFSGTYDGIGITSIPGMSYFNYGDEAIRGYGVIELDESDLSKYDYQTVKFSTLDAEAGTAPETVYDEYDEITYADLKENGNALADTYTISGGHTFTYDATSPSKSAILKFRWTAGTKPGFQFSFDIGENGNIAHPFGVWIKRADQVAPNGAWHLKPNKSDLEVKMDTAVKQGDTFDIELGRLKVLEGDPKIVGQYYVYLKVNGELIQEGYSNTAEDGGYSSGDKYDCMVSNQIRFGGWGNGGDDKISETIVPVTYDEYDEVTYYDLKLNGNPLGAEHTLSGGITFTYDATSPSYSAVFKYRFIAGSKAGVQFSFDEGDNGNIANPFGVWIKRTDQVAPNGAWHLKPNDSNLQVAMSEPLVKGEAYDIELGRLKVLSGKNVGQYYLYLKVNGVLIQETYSSVDENGYYTSGNKTDCQLSNKIRFGCWGNGAEDRMTASPYVEKYEEYDEVTFDDLFIGDISMAGQTMTSNQKYTYKATSSSYSVKLNYRWIPGGEQPKFTAWFDTSSQYPFCFAVKTPNQSDFGAVAGPNGAWHLVPSNADLIVQMDQPIVAGQPYDIEIGRLKVLNGANKGKYYVYFNVNDETIQSYYYDGVDADGKYNDGAIALSNTVRINIPAGNSVTAIPVPETYDEYDEIGFNDLYLDGTSVDGQIIDGGDRKYTYDATSSSYSMVLKYRWIPGGETLGFTSYLDDWKFPFCFCAKYPNRSDFGAAAGANGAWHLVPSNGDLIVQMDQPVVAGEPYDIEIGRLKVLTGSNKDKYYVYVKVNDELIQSYYYDGVVDGVYDGVALSNKIIIASAAGNAFCDISTVIEEEDPNPDALYYTYDEIEYGDLKDANGNALGNEKVLSGGTTLTYDSTSATGSVLFKYRWTVGSVPKVQMSFEKASDSSMAYRFGAWLDVAADEYTNGSLWVGPSYGPKVNMPNALVAGGTYDVEFARLKVKNGENAGKYHVYYKLNGVLIAEYYVDADIVDENGNYTSGPDKNITLNVKSGEIFFAHWGSEGNKISATPVPETYEAYDEIGFDNLYVGDISMAGQTMTSKQDYTYNATSPSYSAIFKYRWIPGGDAMKFSTYFDDWKYPFCFASKTPNQTGFGATAGPNGSWHLVPSNDSMIVHMGEPVVAGKAYDIEIARLKVANGVNAGKYYVYAKVNGEMIQSYYYDGVVDGVYNGTALSNNIIIDMPAGNSVTATPYVQEYEAYDEIGMEDLKNTDGNALGSQLGMSGATTLTYDKTSPTGSVIFKYRWKIGTVPKFQMSFEKTSDTAMAYMFGAWLSAPGEEADYPNGRMWLRPGMGPQVNMEDVLVAGTTHNVEFARLKVKNGPNKGKYYVYIKIDDILVADDYVAADIVDANGNYTSNPDSTSLTISNEIFFAFWGSEGNSILAYRELGSNEHDGTRGDFDGDGVINGTDLTVLRKILLGALDTSEMPEGIADFNNDGSVDVRDLVSMKKYLAPVNSYEKDGALVLGVQEHLNEDYTKTAEYIADASATLGATAYRLSTPIHTLYYANKDNSVTVKEDAMNEFKGMVAALKAKGINEILYVTDSFILPYGYANSMVNHNITVPDPNTDPDNYVAWLTVNASAFTELAKEVPEIKFFEPFNEINTKGTRFEKYGCPWEATEEQKAAHKFTVKEKAAIMADLCWYLSDAVKSVDSANQVTTPSIVVGSNSVIENDFIDEFYKAIESGLYPTNKTLGDIKVDNYFTIVNLHAYPDYTEDDALLWDNFESNAANEINEWAGYINTAYATVKSHNDGGSRVWITETGMSTYHSDGAVRNEDNVARLIELALEKLDNELTFIDTAIFYKIADISTDRGASPSETYFGLFRSGDDLDDPYAAKPSAKAIYKFFHNGSTDYSALEALVDRYAE